MKLIRARVSGFCMGVRRAVALAEEAAAEQAASSRKNVYTLGPLIHNSKVLSGLEAKGVKVLAEADIPAAPSGSVVIVRAHGIPPHTMSTLTGRGFTVLDATCPHVKASQETAFDYAAKGYVVFLAGEKDHAEIIGIAGHAQAALSSLPAAPLRGGCCFAGCLIVGSAAEAEEAARGVYSRDSKAKTVLLGQTTISEHEYLSIGESIRAYFPEIEIIDTICGATAARQKALKELCQNCDAVIVAGSGESANTRRLVSLACGLGKPAWLVEDPADIPAEAAAYKTVGLAAGASTPDNLVDAIEATLTAV